MSRASGPSDRCTAGQVDRLAPGITRVVAPNPSAMTGPGTNSYVLGNGPFAVVDPAVEDETHLARLTTAAEDNIGAILLTHRHPDHAGGAATLAERTGAPILAWPKAVDGAHDRAVTIDEALADRQCREIGGLSLIVHHTPGHAADHVVFELPDSGLLLAGDTLMAEATVVIIPPDGDMQAYFETLHRLGTLSCRAIAPGHGGLLEAPAREIARVIAHRRQREAQIVDQLDETSATTAASIVDRLYPALDPRLRAMAAAQVEAHLLALAADGRADRAVDGWRSRSVDNGR